MSEAQWHSHACMPVLAGDVARRPLRAIVVFGKHKFAKDQPASLSDSEIIEPITVTRTAEGMAPSS